MKKNLLFILVICVCVTGYFSCKREYNMKSPTANITGKSFLKIVDASPNFRKIFNFADSFNVLVNGNRITSYTVGTAPIMTYGAIFPTSSSGYGYVAVDPGTAIIKLSVGISNPDSIQIASVTKTLLADKYYTLMITDSLNSGRDSTQIFVQDVYSTVPTGYYNLRFIHAVYNDTVGKNVDIWSTRANRYLWTNLKPGSITSFSSWAYNPILSDTLIVRRSGAPLVALDSLNTASFSNQRTYTLYFRGDGTISLNSNLKKRRLATYLHQ